MIRQNGNLYHSPVSMQESASVCNVETCYVQDAYGMHGVLCLRRDPSVWRCVLRPEEPFSDHCPSMQPEVIADLTDLSHCCPWGQPEQVGPYQPIRLHVCSVAPDPPQGLLSIKGTQPGREIQLNNFQVSAIIVISTESHALFLSSAASGTRCCVFSYGTEWRHRQCAQWVCFPPWPGARKLALALFFTVSQARRVPRHEQACPRVARPRSRAGPSTPLPRIPACIHQWASALLCSSCWQHRLGSDSNSCWPSLQSMLLGAESLVLYYSCCWVPPAPPSSTILQSIRILLLGVQQTSLTSESKLGEFLPRMRQTLLKTPGIFLNAWMRWDGPSVYLGDSPGGPDRTALLVCLHPIGHY